MTSSFSQSPGKPDFFRGTLRDEMVEGLFPWKKMRKSNGSCVKAFIKAFFLVIGVMKLNYFPLITSVDF